MESQDERHNNKLSRRDLVKFSVGTVAASTLVPGLLQQKVFTPQKAFAQPAGQSKLQEVLNRKVLIVGTGSTNPPWHFEDAQGNLIGMDIDLARLVAKGLFEDAKKVQFVREAPDARIPNLVTNKVDGGLPVYDGDGDPGSAGRVHHPLLPRGRCSPRSERRQA